MKKVVLLSGILLLTLYSSSAYAIWEGEIDITYYSDAAHTNPVGFEFFSCGHVHYLSGHRTDYRNWYSPGECPDPGVTESELMQCAQSNPWNPITGYHDLQRCIEDEWAEPFQSWPE